jgi:hypothetical protein
MSMATINQLEDLRPVLMEMLMELNRPVVLFRPHRVELEAAGLVQHAGGDLYERTDLGDEMVTDYQRRNSANPTEAKVSAEDALAAANKRIAELEGIVNALIQPDTYRANALGDMAYKLGRYGATNDSRQDDMADYIQGVIKRLKDSQA